MIRQHIHQPPATTGGLQARPNASWYRCEMRMLAFGMAGVFTLAACSGGSSTANDPTTTILEPPASAQPTTIPEPATTTTSTTVPATTSTATTTTEPPIVVVQPATSALPVDAEALFAEAFAGYEEAFAVLRLAYTDPGKEELRNDVRMHYREPLVQVYLDGLDEQVTKGQKAVHNPADPNRVTPIQLVSTSVDGRVVHFLACETLTSTVVMAETGEVTYEGVDSGVIQVFVELIDGLWQVTNLTEDESLPGEPSCESVSS